MKQKEFIELLAQRSDTSVKHTAIVVDNFFALIVERNRKGDELVFKHGKFFLKKKPATPARKGICPFTKVEKTFPAKPASAVPVFRPSKFYKDAVVKK